jgi:hypothetical protein
MQNFSLEKSCEGRSLGIGCRWEDYVNVVFRDVNVVFREIILRM